MFRGLPLRSESLGWLFVLVTSAVILQIDGNPVISCKSMISMELRKGLTA